MVWVSFEAIQVKQPDGIEVEQAQCKYCKALLTSSSNGTSHLRRHREKCMASHGQVDTTRQTQLQRNPDGSVSTWQYDPDRVREHLVLYCAATDQPIGFQENPHFQYLINNAFNPQYVLVSRNTTMSDLIRTFQKRRTELISELQNISFSIALTSDIWSGRSKQDYLCVTGHYVDTEWILQKKLLGFRVMDYSHTAQNINDAIMSVIQDYGIQNLILSITLDNASANSKAIELFDNSTIPNTAVKFFHARCACHIINLIVKSGLKQVESRIDNIREALSWIMASNQRIAEFSRYCASNDILAHPRFIFNGLEVFSKELGESLGLSETDVAEHLRTLKSQMFEIFSIYENRYSHGTAETGASSIK
ncbi:hypothetical protein Dsin_022532 [Dipteronia sinensis]|uniref:BED-type domain-containing protein n=1 Tax=Dipteronia sinensis TaxID=43782 RepID=A0AAE0A2M0_9ROSI|nr:hypothetical protein Dsin_022532 [Dipteronia sinensis]